jgi:Glycosyltransferases involved in cell wall biogenesis
MLSAVILTKNEEKNIERCLESLDFVDEIIIVDDYSSDRTLSLIKNEKIKIKNDNSKLKIFKRSLNGDFAGQRNFGLEKTNGEWVLFLDADEEITDELKKEIKEMIRYATLERDDLIGFYIKRRDFFWGREVRFGEVLKARSKGLMRLIRKKYGKWQGKVHEELEIGNRKLEIRKLKNFINHYPHSTIKEFLEEVNFYSTLRAQELFSHGKRTNIFQIIFYPFFKFILTYLFI